MKKAVTVISIICVVIIAAVVLVLTGVIDVKEIYGKISGNKTAQAESLSASDESAAAETDETEKNAVQTAAAAWISYMDTCVLVDKNGVITGTTETAPENIMKLSGVDITRMVIGDPVEVSDPEAFEYGMLVANKLAAVGISDKGEVYISSDGSANLYIKNVKILLGKNENLLEKLEALRKFYNKVIDLDGTLDMQELDRNNMGYTFKVNGAGSENHGDGDTETGMTGDALNEDEGEETVMSDDDGNEADDPYGDGEDDQEYQDEEQEEYLDDDYEED